jgi:hypothetical protein
MFLISILFLYIMFKKRDFKSLIFINKVNWRLINYGGSVKIPLRVGYYYYKYEVLINICLNLAISCWKRLTGETFKAEKQQYNDELDNYIKFHDDLGFVMEFLGFKFVCCVLFFYMIY